MSLHPFRMENAMSVVPAFNILTPVFFDKKSGTRRRIENKLINEGEHEGDSEYDAYLCEGSSKLLPGDPWKIIRPATDADWKDATGL